MERLSKDEVRMQLEVQKEVIDGVTYYNGVQVKKLPDDPRIHKNKTGYEMCSPNSNNGFARSCVRSIIAHFQDIKEKKALKRKRGGFKKMKKLGLAITVAQKKECDRLGIPYKDNWPRKKASTQIHKARINRAGKEVAIASMGNNLSGEEIVLLQGGRHRHEYYKLNKKFRKMASEVPLLGPVKASKPISENVLSRDASPTKKASERSLEFQNSIYDKTLKRQSEVLINHLRFGGCELDTSYIEEFFFLGITKLSRLRWPKDVADRKILETRRGREKQFLIQNKIELVEHKTNPYQEQINQMDQELLLKIENPCT